MYRESDTRQDRIAIAERTVPVAKARNPIATFHSLIPLIVVVLVALAFVVR